MSSPSDSIKREIDEYQDESNGSRGDSSGSFESSSNSSSQDEHYLFGVPGIPLNVFQEEMQCRATFGAEASLSKRDKSSSPFL